MFYSRLYGLIVSHGRSFSIPLLHYLQISAINLISACSVKIVNTIGNKMIN